jgi:hypothetical protein
MWRVTVTLLVFTVLISATGALQHLRRSVLITALHLQLQLFVHVCHCCEALGCTLLLQHLRSNVLITALHHCCCCTHVTLATLLQHATTAITAATAT